MKICYKMEERNHFEGFLVPIHHNNVLGAGGVFRMFFLNLNWLSITCSHFKYLMKQKNSTVQCSCCPFGRGSMAKPFPFHVTYS